jgi:hypothetical protein
MGRAYSTNGIEEEFKEGIGAKARRKETTGKTETYVGGTVLKWRDRMGWYGSD